MNVGAISQALHPPKEAVECIDNLNILWLNEQKKEFPSIFKDGEEATNKNMWLLMWAFSYMDWMLEELLSKVSECIAHSIFIDIF